MDYDDESDEAMDMDQHQRKFFDVGPFDPRKVDLNKPAMTAEEYLKQVIVGRSQEPAIAVASNISLISTKSPTTKFTNCLENQLFVTRFGPDKEWRTAKVNEFSFNRSLLEGKKPPPDFLKEIKLPNTGDSMGWCQVCFERRIPELEINENDKDKQNKFAHHKGTPPTIGLVKSFNDNLVNHLILHQTEYVIENGQTRAILEWIYALLLVVKKPLLHDVCSALRDFCRKCREWRSQMNEDELDEIYELSWFITIISCYFAQRDLAD